MKLLALNKKLKLEDLFRIATNNKIHCIIIIPRLTLGNLKKM